MDLNGYLERVQTAELGNLFDNADFSLQALEGSARTAAIVALGILAVIGILWCLFGLKLVRFWSAVIGFAIGFVLGAGVAAAFEMEQMVVVIAGVVAAVLVACLGAVIYRVGVFLVVLVTGTSFALSVIQPEQFALAGVCLGIGLVLALFAVKFAEPVTMVVTGLNGALLLGAVVDACVPVDGEWVQLAATVAFAVLGIWIQFLMESRRRKKQNLKKADEIREQCSTENEVERARAMMDNLDDIPEDEAGHKISHAYEEYEDDAEFDDEYDIDDDDDITYID